MESSYEIINPANNKHFTSPMNQKQNQFSHQNYNQNLQKSSSNPRLNQTDKGRSTNDLNSNRMNGFDPVKITNKLEYDQPSYSGKSSNQKEFPMKLFSMQQMQHNVDLVVHTYIKKVIIFKLLVDLW